MREYKKYLWAALCAVMLSISGVHDAKAQLAAVIGNGTLNLGGAEGPYYEVWWNNKVIYLIRPAELEAAGIAPGSVLQSIAFQPANNPLTLWPANRSMTIRLLETDQQVRNPGELPFPATEGTVVFNNPSYNVPATPSLVEEGRNWVVYNFETPFLWTGRNLQIEVCTQRGGWSGTYQAVLGGNAGFNSTQYSFTDGVNVCGQQAWPSGGSTIVANRPNMRFTYLAGGIEASFPDDNNNRVLRSGNVYDAMPNRPYMDYRSPGSGVLTYRIIGPLPDTTTRYRALKNGSSNMAVAGGSGVLREEITSAEGPFAGLFGALDLRNAAGGNYRVVASYSSAATGRRDWVKDFIVAVDNDISTREILSPFSNLAPRLFKYPQNVDADVTVRFQNVGLNTVTSFEVSATITAPNGAVWTRRDTVRNVALATGADFVYDFPRYTSTNQIGVYQVQACARLLRVRNAQGVEVAVNEDLSSRSNDCLPKQGEAASFEVQYDVDLEAIAVLNPSSSIVECANNPIRPLGRVRNVGINDQSDVPVRMRIFRLPNLTTPVYNERIIFQSVPTGGQPVNEEFPVFIPSQPGQYRAVLSTETVGDPVASNDTAVSVFSINDQLAGTYTVGQGGNYPTIDAAFEALFDCGVRGPVVLELTDGEYIVGNSSALSALDLTTRIVGVSESNTITIRPSVSRSQLPRSVTVTLRSSTGRGIVFGQSWLTPRLYAVQNIFPSRQNANSAGFITFDGGERKSLVFRLESSSPHRSAFYFGRGSLNNAVKNSWIENSPNSTPSYTVSLPRQEVGSSLTFEYEPDIRTVQGQPVTYSAAVVNRNTVPVNERSGNNDERLDTLLNTNNVVEGNIISGFGYGVVTLGNGALAPNQTGIVAGYYNQGTKIINNRIENVARAGIYAGYEDGVEIRGNYIANVGNIGGYTGDAAGVMLGSSGDRYHNTRVRIDGNEIVSVQSNTAAAGIVITQNANTYQANRLFTFPEGNTDNRTWNNVVRGVVGNTSTAMVAGIHYQTGRFVNTSTGVVDPSRAQVNDYWTTGDKVFNNTVVLAPGSVSQSNGFVIGLGFEQSRGAVVENNAVALLHPAFGANAVQAALYWYGAVDAQNGIKSNSNAYWMPSTAGVPNSTFAWLIETTPSNETIENSGQNKFRTIGQWRALTGQDQTSTWGDFVSEHVVVDGKLRLQSNPTPIGSLLNNRGSRLDWLTTDIDGKVRGESNQLFDIGAVEFNGRFYLNDIESEEIVSPRAYRSLSGTTSDAEYIMGQSTNTITAQIRNSGSLPQTNVELTAEVYMEQANGQYGSTPVVTATRRVSLLDGARQEVTFTLNNFSPRTYAELPAYTVPSRFASMTQNVTPKYRLVVRSASDQNAANNVYTKDVRYWVKRSNTGIIVSVSGTANAIATQQDLASRLNADTLLAAMRQLQWSYSAGDYDIIDRGAWESEAFDYTPYAFVFWSQGRTSNDAGLSRTQREDIRQFVAAGTVQSKKNLLFASEEVARAHTAQTAVNDGLFVNRVLRARLVTTPQNTPRVPSYADNQIEGVRVASTYREVVRNTGVTFNGLQDIGPRPALLQVYSDTETEGLAQPAYKYLSLDAGVSANTMGTAVSAPRHNVVFYGMDWRHAGRIAGDDESGAQRMLIGALDYFKSNGGFVLPVELASFTAEKASSDRVSVRWETSSEINSDRFEVERAEVGGEYESIGRVSAAGTSTERRSYGYVDADANRPVVYSYRLRMVDLDGSEAYSQSVEVDMRDGARGSDVAVSPNPVSGDYTTVEYGVAQEGSVTLRLVSANGQEVRAEELGMRAVGAHSYQLSTSGLPSGSYLVNISVEGRFVASTTVKVIR